MKAKSDIKEMRDTDLEHTPVWARTNPHLIMSQIRKVPLNIQSYRYLLSSVRKELRKREGKSREFGEEKK